MKLIHNGRKRIYADVDAINADNVRQVVEKAMIVHTMNALDLKILYDIEKNIQELSREKEIRPEINVIATDPIASQIVDFKQGYEHGKPINYVQRANIDSTNAYGNENVTRADDLRIATLNEMMRECKKASKDGKLARDIKIGGIGFRYIVPNKKDNALSPFDICILNPMTTFVIYANDVFQTPLAGVTYTESSETQIKKFGVWTIDNYFEFDTSDNKNGIKSVANTTRKIPIIEYINNHDIMGSFEKELPLIDAYNIVTSDRVNDVCQQVQSILWLHNTELDKESKEKLVDGGVIQTKANADGKDAKIQYVNAPLRQADIQTLASSLKERILESAGVPKLSEGNNSTGEAMRVTNGWHTAETQAKTSELTWRESEDATLEVCLAFIQGANVDINDVATLKLSDIDYDMHRSENYDIVSRVNALATLVDRGFDLEKSVAICKVTDDPLQFAMDSKDGVDKLRYSGLSTEVEKPKTEESIQPDTVAY